MKKIITLLLLFVTVFAFNGCSSDDDASAPIDTYLKGKWHSYKAVVSAQNQSVEVDVTQTNQYSQFYYEAYFKDYTVDMSYYNYENNVSSRWVTETDNYRISGNVITIYDNQNAIDFIYNPQNRTMYMRIASETAEYGLMTIFIYFRK